MRRNHLATDDLDWMPPRYRLLRGAIISGVWTGILGSFLAAMLSGAHIIVFGKLLIALGAAGYWVGDRASKGLIAARLGKLARGQVDLARLSNQEDGDLVHVRGRVRVTQSLAGIVTPARGVYRRTRVRFGDTVIVDEEAVDFQLVDDEGNAITIEVGDARLLVADPKLRAWDDPEALFPMAQVHGARRAVALWQKQKEKGRKRGFPAIEAGEVVLCAGDLVEAVGYKARKVDLTVVDRLARETPMRATLRAGKDLPLILSRVEVPSPPFA